MNQKLTHRVTRPEYLLALELVDNYHRQQQTQVEKTKIVEWNKLNYCTNRLRQILLLFKSDLNCEYLEQIDKNSFMRVQNAGIKTWHEFENLRGY